MGVIVNTIFREFSKKSPNWLYVIVKSILYLVVPSLRTKFVWLLPQSSGYWLAVKGNRKLLVPSPKGDWGSFVVDERGIVKMVCEGDTVVDVGACIGSFALSVANKAGKVIAIEPEPRNLVCLRVNVRGVKNIIILGKAVWSNKGIMKLHYTSTVTGHTLLPSIFSSSPKPLIGKYIEVQVDTLDNMLHKLGVDKVDVLRINAEGAEFEILKGAKKILRTVRKIFVMCHDNTIRDEVCKFLKEWGFKLSISLDVVYAERTF